MQKHNQWLSNRGYIQHLNVLTKIQNRRAHTSGKSALAHTYSAPRSETRPSHPQNLLSQTLERPSDLQGSVREKDSVFTRSKDNTSKDNISMRDQQILWDNYYLGKRIIQTPPVISKRRLDDQYRKHKRLVQCLTASSSRKVVPTEFRVKKLQQYKENVELLGEDRAIKAATQRYFLRLQIDELSFYRQRPLLDELALSLSYRTKDGRVRKQSCESFPAGDMLVKHFYFAVPKRLVGSSEGVTVEMKNFKGLEELSVGYFSFPSKADGCLKAQLFHCGKLVGEIGITVQFGKKQEEMVRECAVDGSN